MNPDNPSFRTPEEERRMLRLLELEEMVMKTSLENERLRVAHMDLVKTCTRLAEENERLRNELRT